MSTWVLVLTLWGYSTQSGKAVTAIPGFSSYAACAEAGNAWLKSKPSTFADVTALCMEQKR